MRVAIALMEAPPGQHYGYDLSRRSGVQSGVLYPILHRMLNDELLTDGWSPSPSGRPPRRYYEITEKGAIELIALISGLTASSRGRMKP